MKKAILLIKEWSQRNIPAEIDKILIFKGSVILSFFPKKSPLTCNWSMVLFFLAFFVKDL